MPAANQNKTVHAMSHATATWLDNQSAAIRAELNNLIAYQAEAEFIRLLVEMLPVVPCPGLIDLYYDIWHCVPSRLALKIAVRQVHVPEELAAYLALTERVLVDDQVCQDFDDDFSDDDDLEEIGFWLKRRVRR